MKSVLIWVSLLGLVLLSPSAGEAQVAGELDSFWAEMSRTVEEGDFEGYCRLYHPDAVLVSLGSATSYPIAQALARWEQGFLDTQAGESQAGVTFRLTQRFHDDTSAHETGIFRYTMKPKGEDQAVAMVHFEALLVRKEGAWRMVMEFQKQAATEEEWEEAK